MIKKRKKNINYNLPLKWVSYSQSTYTDLSLFVNCPHTKKMYFETTKKK